MPERRVDHPIILGIVGDSAAGKTTLTSGIAAILGRDRVATICTDDYHRYDRRQRAELGITPLHPDCNYVDIMEQHLRLLRQGQPILKPVYNHSTGTFDPPEYVAPRPYIIVEGLLGYHTRAMRACYDVKVYLEPEEQLRIKWKIHRDTTKRGYTPEQVLRQIEERREDTERFIKPQRTFADIVVTFYPPEGQEEETGAHLNVRHVLRPTLPHPDLSPILDVDPNGHITLRLARDRDGKPVDVLEIRGDIPEGKAKRVEDLLWSLIPEASHLRQNVGRYEEGRAISHPLALTQLLLAYHMVKAAQGVYAI